MSVLGTRVVRSEDPRFLTVGGTYTADLADERLAGAVHVTFVRSLVAHGTILAVDTDDAREAPGVVGVWRAADLTDLNPPGTERGATPGPLVRPWLATGTVRFVGEPVAAVVTERADQGEDAAELVIVDVDPLPAVVDVEASVTDEVLLFPDHGTNVVASFPGPDGDDLFADCEVVVHQRIVNQRLAACPLEVRGAAAVWEGGRLTLWCSTQAAHGVRANLARAFSLDEGQVRVIAPDVGGGFGAKINITPEEVVVCWLARELGRPVRWTETRSENMVAMPHGRAQLDTVTLGGTRDGRLLAYRLDVLQDAGAYQGTGAWLPYMTRLMTQGCYDIPAVAFSSRSVVTNTTVVEAYRGAGRPEAALAVERAVDLFAAEIGLDPVEVRRRNLIAPEQFPFTTHTGSTYDCGRYAEALDRVLAAADEPALRAEQARRRAAGEVVQLGIGVSVYVEITAGPFPGEREYARLEVHPDGSATVYTGSSAHGQGHATSWQLLVHDRLGIPLDRITVVHGDTDRVPEGTGTYGSRSLQIGGSAVVEVAGRLAERARALAAELLGVDPAEVELDTELGGFHVRGNREAAKTWADVAAAGALAGGEAGGLPGAGLVESTVYAATSPTFPFGAHVAVVEVDTETGEVRLARLVTCDDAGRIVNPVVVEGQRHGGIAQGVAQALTEEVRYDEDGNPVTSNFADYGVISAAELPAYELVVLETPTPVNELGAKGIGESGTIGSTPAVQNAVVDALAHLGVRHVDLPCTAERVWRAIEAARAPEGGR